jgi:hypothetical protein
MRGDWRDGMAVGAYWYDQVVLLDALERSVDRGSHSAEHRLAKGVFRPSFGTQHHADNFLGRHEDRRRRLPPVLFQSYSQCDVDASPSMRFDRRVILR